MIFRWRFYVGKRPMNYMDDDEAGGEDPKMNSCSPSHVRLHRSNCDCKVVMNKFGPAMYVCKGAAEYACKMEVASQDYEAIMNKNLRFNNGCFKAPEEPFRNIIFSDIARDYPSQEAAAMALQLKGVQITDPSTATRSRNAGGNERAVAFSFPRKYWQNCGNEIEGGVMQGHVEHRWNPHQIYFNR